MNWDKYTNMRELVKYSYQSLDTVRLLTYYKL